MPYRSHAMSGRRRDRCRFGHLLSSSAGEGLNREHVVLHDCLFRRFDRLLGQATCIMLLEDRITRQPFVARPTPWMKG
jgi:hypothetical protein